MVKRTKKITALLLSLLLLSAAAGCGQTAAAPAPTAEPAPTATAAPQEPVSYELDELEEVNTFESLMGRHQSIRITAVSYPDETQAETMVVYYEDELIALQSEGWQGLYCDDLMLESRDEDPDPLVKLLLDEEVFQEQVWYYRNLMGVQFDGETVVKASSENGELVLVTKTDDPEEIKELLDECGQPYTEDAQTCWSYVFDEATLEQREVFLTVERDGEEKLLQKWLIEYDVEYDRESSPFAAYLTAPAHERRSISVVYAPGTELETERSYSLPKSARFLVLAGGDEDNEYYLDEGCTQPYEGSAPEDYSDLRLYIPLTFHDVGEENEALLRQLAELNTTEEKLSRHAAVQCVSTACYEDEALRTNTTYIDADSYLEFWSDGSAFFVDDTIMAQAYEDGQLAAFLMPAEEYRSEQAEDRHTLDMRILEEEKPVLAIQHGGYTVFMTEMSDGDAVRDSLERSVEFYGGGYEYQDGMTIVYTYFFDEMTGDLCRVLVTLREADGLEHRTAEDSYRYFEQPQDFDGLDSPLSAIFEEEKLTRTVTVVYGPGTAEEFSQVYHLPEEAHVGVIWNGESKTIFKDPELTEVLTERPAETEFTIYVG